MADREFSKAEYDAMADKILARELTKAGFSVKVEVPVHVIWDDEDMGVGYRADTIVNDLIVLELKASEPNYKLFGKQVLTYLKLLNRRLGYVINFNEVLLKDGIHRVANDLR